MSGDEYMALLLERQAEHQRQHPGALPPLLEWLVEPGDTDLFTPPAPAPKPTPTPRQYLPASHWQRLRDKAQAELDALTATTAMPERAASTGEGIGAHRAPRYHQALDQAVQRGAALTRRIEHLNYKIRTAQQREGTDR